MASVEEKVENFLAIFEKAVAGLLEEVEPNLVSYLDEFAELEKEVGLEEDAAKRYRVTRTNAYKRGAKSVLDGFKNDLAPLVKSFATLAIEEREPAPAPTPAATPAATPSAPVDPSAPPSMLGVQEQSHSIRGTVHTINGQDVWIQPSAIMQIISNPVDENGLHGPGDPKDYQGRSYVDPGFTYTHKKDSKHTLAAQFLYDQESGAYICYVVEGPGREETRLLPLRDEDDRCKGSHCVVQWVDKLRA